MSKKDFIALADVIRNHNEHQDYDDCFSDAAVEALADFCQSQNPRFNRQRWLDYISGKCGPSGGIPKLEKTPQLP